MFSFLLDENMSPEIARQIRQKRCDIPISSMSEWQDGRFMAARDEAILKAAAASAMTLVTFDQKTIVPILVQWGQLGLAHAGVIFVDDRTMPGANFGVIIHALIAHWDAHREESPTNSVYYLRPAAGQHESDANRLLHTD